MTCTKPGITPIDPTCGFDCFTEGRDTYMAPLAIVLHEVDEALETLNNRVKNCVGKDYDERGCHDSFHFGIDQDGQIYQWVDTANSAWSFDPNNNDTDCGICGWSVALAEGANVDPNLYTINIAIETGFLAHGSNVGNNYTDSLFYSTARLVGWLAETYSIPVNVNTIWRHCDELDDFPSCDCCKTYESFLDAVQTCIDTTVADACCNVLDCVPPASPTLPAPCDMSGWNPAHDCPCDASCKANCCCVGTCVCGCQSVVSDVFFGGQEVNISLTGLPFQSCMQSGGNQGLSVRIDPDNQTNTLVMEFDVPQNNLFLAFQLDNNDVLTFMTTPTSVTGDANLVGNVVTGTVLGGTAIVEFVGPMSQVTMNYTSTVNPVVDDQNVCLYNILSDELFCDRGNNATPGATEFLGRDCQWYTLPIGTGTGDVTCDELAATANIGLINNAAQVILPDCTRGQVDICNLLTTAGLTPEDPGANSVALGINDVGTCTLLNMPTDVCTFLEDTPPTLQPFANGSRFLGLDNGGNCAMFALDVCTILTEVTPATIPLGATNLVLGTADGVCGMLDLNLDFCSLAAQAANTPAFNDPTLPTYLLQPNQVGGTCLIEIGQSDSLANCVGQWQPLALTVNPQNGNVAWRRVAPTFRGVVVANGGTIDPSATGDGVFKIDASAGDVTVTLNDMPSSETCDQRLVYVKRMDTVAGNTVTINGNIEGVATSIVLNTPGPRGNFGESTPLFWDGAQWLLL